MDRSRSAGLIIGAAAMVSVALGCRSGTTADSSGHGGGGLGGSAGAGATAGSAGGYAGAGATAGSGMTAGSGGASDDGGSDDAFPCCVADLLARCPMQGACRTAPDDAGTNSRTCYASGVKAVQTNESGSCGGADAGPFGFRRTTEVYGEDGALCYSMQTYCICGQACEIEWTDWRDGSGTLTAQAEGGKKIACLKPVDGGYTADPSGGTCAKPPAAPACESGICP
jgi:hypothetical protein